MARDRSRSRSPRRRLASPRRRRSESPDVRLPAGVEPITEDDYFLQNDAFRLWLKEEKRKYLDEITGEKARSYFRKFVKAWNRGKLSRSTYTFDATSVPATSQTGYKWNFQKTKADTEALAAVRESVGAATHSAGPSSSRTLGPTMPSASDLVLARENAAEYGQADRDYQRKRDKRDAMDRVEDMVGPKAVGREGMLEKKRARREGDKAFRDKDDDGFVADESTLLGAGDSFKERIAKRDAARKRFEEKKNPQKEERMAVVRERVTVIKEKDKATMDMFQQMAKQRFG